MVKNFIMNIAQGGEGFNVNGKLFSLFHNLFDYGCISIYFIILFPNVGLS